MILLKIQQNILNLKKPCHKKYLIVNKLLLWHAQPTNRYIFQLHNVYGSFIRCVNDFNIKLSSSKCWYTRNVRMGKFVFLFFLLSIKKKLLNKSPFCSLVIHFPSKQKKKHSEKILNFEKVKKNYLNFHNIISQSDSQQSINQSVSHSFIIKSIKTKFSYIRSLSKNTRKQHQSISSFFYH